MTMMILQSVWGFVWSTASIATLVGIAAVFVAIALPKWLYFITDLRKWAIVVAAIAFSYTSIAGKFYHDGLKEKQRQWDVALQLEAARSETAREDAERAVGAEPADRSLFRNDPFNRNRDGKLEPCRTGERTKGPVR
jgi:Tfp pilus assembly major pilin PilA